MSESKARWGVTVLENGNRRRSFKGGEVFATTSRSLAHGQAALYENSAEARLVKLTRRAKGWRPASEPPTHGRMVLCFCSDGVRRLGVFSVECREWSTRTDTTHWRELPAGPK